MVTRLVTRMGAREARNNFSELLGNVHYGDQVVIVERSGRPMVAVIPIEMYDRLVAEREGRLQVADRTTQAPEAAHEKVEQDVSGGEARPAAAEMLPVIIDRIVRGFQPERIILFGSHARGEAGQHSDIDLLVVLPEVTDKRKAAVAIAQALGDLTVSKDIIVTTPEEIIRRGDLVGTVLRPALREGKVLYERG